MGTMVMHELRRVRLRFPAMALLFLLPLSACRSVAGFEPEVAYELRHVRYLPVARLADDINALLSPSGRPMPYARPGDELIVIPDERTNVLHIRGSKNRIDALLALIERLDVEPARSAFRTSNSSELRSDDEPPR